MEGAGGAIDHARGRRRQYRGTACHVPSATQDKTREIHDRRAADSRCTDTADRFDNF